MVLFGRCWIWNWIWVNGPIYFIILQFELVGRGRGDVGFYQRSFDDVEGFGRGGREMHRSQSWEERYTFLNYLMHIKSYIWYIIILIYNNTNVLFTGQIGGLTNRAEKIQVCNFFLSLFSYWPYKFINICFCVNLSDAAPGHFQINHSKCFNK